MPMKELADKLDRVVEKLIKHTNSDNITWEEGQPEENYVDQRYIADLGVGEIDKTKVAVEKNTKKSKRSTNNIK